MEKLQEKPDNKVQIIEKPGESIIIRMPEDLPRRCKPEDAIVEHLEYVEAKVLIPKQVLEFYKAVHMFGKFTESLEEYMGYQLTVTLEADLGNNLENLLDMKEIVRGHGLDKAGIKADC
jgi:hypothetical protein